MVQIHNVHSGINRLMVDNNYICYNKYYAMLSGGYGDWSSEGCITSSNDSQIMCQCDHLTSFAILLVSMLLICHKISYNRMHLLILSQQREQG